MLIQTLAIFVDAYRELNAKKLFWLTLLLSGVVVLAIAALGIGPEGVKIIIWNIDIPGINSRTFPPEVFYKTVFANLGIDIWLTWVASILALISVASLFPDFLSSGSIELTLSKPIGRLRLFGTKYVAGLLFVTLQVLVFTGACFLVIGIRGRTWEPGLFWSVPIVVCFFSYLYAMCVLVGLLTRSTIASLLITLLFWLFLFLLNTGDMITLQIREFQGERISAIESRIQRMEGTARENLWKQKFDAEHPADEANPGAEAPPVAPAVPEDFRPVKEELDKGNPFLPGRRADLEKARKSQRTVATVNRWFFVAKTIFPKTAETVKLLERKLISAADLKNMRAEQDEGVNIKMNDEDERVDQQRAAERVQGVLRSRSVGWIVGSSLAFEALLLGLTGWLFCRRDF